MFKNLKKYKIILIDEKSLGVKEISSKSLFYLTISNKKIWAVHHGCTIYAVYFCNSLL